ncbi:hypothetical protein BBJ28_00007194 [Nothophytophthora sp. Chile5]|nr:hypothetical protein BBJ28_00007194 [Nothophytophthora sp. Chile5]
MLYPSQGNPCNQVHDESAAAEASNVSPPDVTGVMDAELAQCVAVLCKLHGNKAHEQFQNSPRFKSLRSALLPLIPELRGKFFHGHSADHDSTRQEKKRARKVERARQKALDQQYVNNTKLRAERLARLAALKATNPLLAHVPDGVASDGGHQRLITQTGEHTQDDAIMVDVQGTEGGEGQAAERETGNAEQLHYHRACYTCKVKFRTLHHFYDRMCPSCAELNYKKRLQNADLSGHVAIVTGARVKIGFEITLKLLRSGATVVATTRFPKDAAFRYAKEQDFDNWKDRLQIYGMDFRDLGVIDKFMDHIDQTTNTQRFIINVSAMEGKFYRKKTANHPHTNMAKAAANMMTRTCAEDLARKGIFMNSVDTVRGLALGVLISLLRHC